MPALAKGVAALPPDLAALSRRDWEQTRRPGLLQFYKENVYGAVPEGPALQTGLVSCSCGERGRVKKVYALCGNGFAMHLSLYLPAGAGAYPVLLYLLLEGQTDAFVPVERFLSHDCAVALVAARDIAHDGIDARESGIFALRRRQGLGTAGCGVLGAWAWGLNEARACLAREEHVRADEICLAGYSRGGKSALWACAYYGGYAACAAIHSGCGGAALFRRIPAGRERVTEITHAFPHWFVKGFCRYAGREEDLPVDQHLLLALCAPCRLCILDAAADPWCDAAAEKAACELAAPVFALYPQAESGLSYFVRPGGHDVEMADWDRVLRLLLPCETAEKREGP